MLDLLGFHFYLLLLPVPSSLCVKHAHHKRVQNLTLGYIWKTTRDDHSFFS